MVSALQRDGRRRRARRPAGWLVVEVETGEPGRYVAGRLVDTSDGGLGLVAEGPLQPGWRVRVSRGGATAEVEPDAPPWEGREARVAYTSALPDGRWRVGLAFPPKAPSEAQLWGTRLVLAGVLVMVLWPAVSAGTAGSVIVWIVAAGVVALLAAVEWQHRTEVRSYRKAMENWGEVPVQVAAA